MKSIILIASILFFSAKVDVEKNETSYNKIVSSLSPNKDYTIVYLWKPWCKPCIDYMPYLGRLNKSSHLNVILLTTKDEKINLASKYGFEHSYYFNDSIYKTHTHDYDEYDQFNSEVFKFQNIKQPKNRMICPAIFVFDKKGSLVHFNKGTKVVVDSAVINRLVF